MKKISLFACALAVSAMAVAHEKIQVKNLNKETVYTVDLTKSAEMNQEPTAPAFAEGEALPLAKVANATVVESQYYYIDGMMHCGLTTEGGQYYPRIIIPFLDSVVWKSYYKNDVAPTWYSGKDGKSVWEADSYTMTANYDIASVYYLPILGGGTYNPNDSTSFIFRPYIYGEIYAANARLLSGMYEDYIPMSLCQLYSDTVSYPKGTDIFLMGAGKYGKYAYGTNLVLPEGTPYAGRVDTMMQIVENPSGAVFKINYIDFPIYGQATDSIGSMIPEGAKVKVEIVPVKITAQGRSIYLQNPIATTTFDASDFTAWGKSTGMITATFKELNDWGIEEEVPVYVKGAYAVVLTNYNESGCNFGIRSDRFCPKTNSTIFKKNGKMSTIWDGGGSNLAINYVGYWPAVYEDNDTKEMVAPVEGGIAAGDSSNVLYFFTNVDFESYIDGEEEVEEWMTVAYDTTYYSSNDVVMAIITCDPLPAGVSYREGNAVFNFDGNLYTIKVTQGTPATGLKGNKAEAEDLKKVVRNGQVFIQKGQKLFNVLGNEVK